MCHLKPQADEVLCEKDVAFPERSQALTDL